MNDTFRQHVEALHPALDRLLADVPFRVADLSGRTVPSRGIYLFTEGDKHLYVGRSDDIRQRLQQHTRPSAPQNQAAFAFKLARQACGVLRPTYRREGSRTDLVSQDVFRASFEAQKARVRMMNVRTVEENDANRQALLEMYVSIALGTPYNDFNTT